MKVTARAAIPLKSDGQRTSGSVLDVLRELLGAHEKIDVVLAIVSKLVAHNEALETALAQLRASKNKGETIAPEQLDLFLEKLRAATEGALKDANDKLEKTANDNRGRPETPKPPKQPPVRRPLPPSLPRVDNELRVPDEQRPCPVCGAERRCIGHEVTEVAELVPAQIIVRQDRRELLACDRCDGEVERAPMGDKVVEGGAYGARLVAHLVVGKYCDALPLERQREQLARLGLSVPSASMSDQIHWATELLRPLWRALRAAVLGAEVMHIDATSLPVRDSGTKHQVVLGSLWGCVGVASGEAQAFYTFASTGKRTGQRRGEEGPAELLAERVGPVVADASSIFDRSFGRAALVEIGCNMHARRYFVKALDAGDARAAVPLRAFATLYDVEATAHGASAEERLAARRARSKPVYDELIAWCRAHQPHEPPSSLLGKAIGYLLNQQAALTRFLDDGTLPIDNGVVERLHRRPAVGRKNFLFAGSFAGGERAAIAYSILGSCALVGVNPEQYLADLLPRLARDGVVLKEVPSLLPAAWKRAREAASRA